MIEFGNHPTLKLASCSSNYQHTMSDKLGVRLCCHAFNTFIMLDLIHKNTHDKLIIHVPQQEHDTNFFVCSYSVSVLC